MELARTLGDYESTLDKVLFEDGYNCEKMGRKLLYLAQYLVVDVQRTSDARKLKSLLKRLRSIVKIKLRVLAKSLVKGTYPEEKPWEEVVLKLLHYNAKFNNIREHVSYLDRNLTKNQNGPFISSLEYLLVQYYLKKDDSLLSIFKKACQHFIYVSQECTDHVRFLYQSVHDYCLAHTFDLDGNSHEYQNLLKFSNMGLECLKEWGVYSPDRNFFDAHRIWDNALILMELTGNSNLGLSGMTVLFHDDPYSFLRSLNNVILDCDDINVLFSFVNEQKWKSSLGETIAKLRRPTFANDDFDSLLSMVLLSDYFSLSTQNSNDQEYSGDFGFIRSIRKNFRDSLEDPFDFHRKLISYLDLRFRRNYDTIRRSPKHILSKTDKLWISAATLLVLYYVPQRQIFLKRYLKDGLFRQMVMLNSKFPNFYNHRSSLERLLVNQLQSYIPLELNPYTNLTNSVIKTLSDTTKINHRKTTFVKLYISEETYSEMFHGSYKATEPKWPSLEFREEWYNQVRKYSEEGKTLTGMFDLHSCSMSSPFRLPNGNYLTLLVNMTMASIIYLFNDYNSLDLDGICTLLSTNEKSAVSTNLEKLVQHDILIQSKTDDYYKVNENFKPNSLVSRTGSLRIV